MAVNPSMKQQLVLESPAKRKNQKSSSVTGEQLARDKSRIRTRTTRVSKGLAGSP
jgi:hypothetical protein